MANSKSLISLTAVVTNKSNSNSLQMLLINLHPFLPLLLIFLSLSSLSLFLFSLYKTHNKNSPSTTPTPSSSSGSSSNPLSLFNFKTPLSSHPLFLDILTSNQPPKWAPLPSPPSPSPENRAGVVGSPGNPPEANGSQPDIDVGAYDCDRSGESKSKKKKKRPKKKKHNYSAEEEESGRVVSTTATTTDKTGSDCMYPFTSAASATQRKIKQHYDQLVKSNDAKALTMQQVGQFANCLVEARNELQHKSEVIQRKFTITKALIFKADRSSFDRLYQQIHKLEAEQKRLEEDAAVYNRLQEQLKLSPAYKQMLEIGVRMELEARSGKLAPDPDAVFSDISFEELLAQEKKDSFWQRNGKLRSCS